ncbi:hypothetical protein D1631_15485 [Chryseobacterium nematophagum]|uniref:Uncharacterized protein n=1 Tax=Chryseobacterium nematophagum TaxID=2305228 RepID=A0A3M7TI63_9FLAO|nr:hypothetical protein [Chryseobacterium nematophagum]RNA63231.1 hypothetical protein D1631_15485 [Chryseobacterium nematophagum]
MEVPFYLSFKEFENNYYNNLEKWFEKYHNTSELDYLKNLVEMYSPYLYYNFTNDKIQADASIVIKDCFFPYYERIGISFCTSCDHGKSIHVAKEIEHKVELKTITMMEYAQYILDKINRYFIKNDIIFNSTEKVEYYINNFSVITAREGAEYCIDYDKHQRTLPFLKAYLPSHGQTVDIQKYRDFIFSIVHMADFIDQKLISIQAFDYSIQAKLKSKEKYRVQMNHQFLTLCN